MPKEVPWGTVTRNEPAPEPLSVAVAIAILTVAEVVFVGLFLYGIVSGANSILDQQIMAFWLGSAFLVLTLILVLYRRYFLPDVMVVKRRRAKYEDFRWTSR
ncbi:MAG: DUF7318 family protein [Methanobacteriota archaeon]